MYLSNVILLFVPELCGEKNWVKKISKSIQVCLNICLDIIWTTQTFVTRLRIVLHHHEPEHNLKKLVYYLQGSPGSSQFYSTLWSVFSCEYYHFLYDTWVFESFPVSSKLFSSSEQF